MKLLIVAASLRKDSVNKRLIRAVHRLLDGTAEVRLAELNEFPMPVYDGDLETATGVPEGAKRFSEAIAAVDAVVISTPEYNGSIPGPLKNAIDWMSRLRPVAMTGKPFLLLGASPGALGATRGLWHTRVPFEALGVLLYPQMFGLAAADRAFDAEGKLTDPKQEERVRALLISFLSYAERLRQ